MPFFGMNGLAFVALDLLLVFAVYSTNEAFLTVAQVDSVSRAAARKAIASSKDGKEQAAIDFRTQVVKAMGGQAARYKGSTKEYQAAYMKKTWLR